jgi:pimeloyl-ACP methyl ester carboxylesterase
MINVPRSRRSSPPGPGPRTAELLRPAVAATLAGLLAAAIVPAGVSAAPARQAGPAIPALHWRSCDGGFQCATARVPLNYRHPRGKMISLAVARHLATDPGRRAGTLFINYGGPSEQIEQFVSGFSAIPAALRARFNIVTFDPRGFGLSSAIRCFPSMAAESRFLAALPPFPVGAAQDKAWERTYARFDARCARLGGPLLGHDTTADVARDINLLRQAVGARTLNYLGQSYGTALGATYANLFPATAGHMVLDGNIDPVAWTRGGPLPSALRRGSDLATAATLRSFLDLCGQASTAACAFSAGAPAATRAKFATLERRLLAHPVTFDGHDVTYADMLTAIPLGNVDEWQGIAGPLEQLWTASGGSRHPAAARTATRPAAAPVYAGIEQTFAEVCSDTADPRRVSDYAAGALLAWARAGGYGLYWGWQEEVCAHWPRAADQDRYTGPWNRRTASPLLVIGLTGDPVTAYWNSVAMVRDLARARLLTVRGFGHTEFANPSTCAINDEVRYLTTGALPPAGAICQQNGTPFPAPATPGSRAREGQS